jgi:hypothetical protein
MCCVLLESNRSTADGTALRCTALHRGVQKGRGIAVFFGAERPLCVQTHCITPQQALRHRQLVQYRHTTSTPRRLYASHRTRMRKN